MRDGRPDFPASVIVKASRLGRGHIFNEWASLQFLNRIGELGGLVPSFYGGDRALELLVMEDLGQVRGRHDLGCILEGGDPDLARAALLDHARAMAALHLQTAGREEEFASLRGRFPASANPSKKDQHAQNFAWLLSLLPRLDLPVRKSLRRQVQDAVEALESPDAARAYTRGDVCPSNVSFIEGVTRFFDFEMGAFRPVTLSAVYFRLSHISCFNGNMLPQDLQAAAERAYFEALRPLVPAPEDREREYAAAACSQLVWLLSWYLESALEKDRPRHLASLRQRVFGSLALFGQNPAFHTPYPDLADALRQILGKLDHLWAEPEKTVAIFPAFQNSTEN